MRADLIETLQKYGEISSKYKTEKSLEKLNEKDKGQIPKFELYNEFSNRISWLKPYQILALNRGEKLGILNVKIEKTDKTFEGIGYHYARILNTSPSIPPLSGEGSSNSVAIFPPERGKLKGGVKFPFTEQLQDAFKK